MSRLKELREKRVELATEIRKMADTLTVEKPDFSAEDQTKWDARNKEYDTTKGLLDKEERLADIEKDTDERRGRELPGTADRIPGESKKRNKERTKELPSEEDRALSLQAWFRCQENMRLDDTHVKACRKLQLNPRARHFDIQLKRDYNEAREIYARNRAGWESRAGLLAGTGNVGGYTIPQGFIPRLEIALLQFSAVRPVAEVLRTATGNPLKWPTANDTSNSGEIVGEQGSIGSTTDAAFDVMTLGAFKYSSKLMKITTELLEDSAFDMANILGSWAGERIARKQNSDFTVGGGTTLPYGLVTQSSAGVTAASATAIAADEMIDLQHSLDTAYRDGAAFMFHDNVAKSLRKLKDGNGQYLWQPDFGAGRRDTLLGSPTIINLNMASSIASAAKTVLFGDYSKYKIRDVTTIRLRRLVELYAATDEEGYIMFQRSDGNLLNAGTNPVKRITQA